MMNQHAEVNDTPNYASKHGHQNDQLLRSSTCLSSHNYSLLKSIRNRWFLSLLFPNNFNFENLPTFISLLFP